MLAPDLLLMDEPFSGIDAQNAEIMRRDLRDLAMRERRTVVFVTHDLDEALFLSDRILAMSPRPGAIVDDVTVDKRDLVAVDAGPSGRQPKARVALWERVYRRPS